MLHKHPTSEKLQKYFGITEKAKYDSASFFIYIQPKVGKIYDASVLKALGEDFNPHKIRDKHIAHLSTLLTGGIDHAFVTNAQKIYAVYNNEGITPGEYIKLYQLIMSYLNGEAHKKNWWRYKKYRDLNRAIRNLLLFDLAISTSPEKSASTTEEYTTQNLPTDIKIPEPNIEQNIKADLDALDSYTLLKDCYNALQTTIETTTHEIESYTAFAQPTLFKDFHQEELYKIPSNNNQPLFLEALSQTQQKVSTTLNFIKNDYYLSSNNEKDLELSKTIQEILKDIEIISNELASVSNIFTSAHLGSNSKDNRHHAHLNSLLKNFSSTIEKHLHNLSSHKATFKEKLKKNQKISRI